MHTYPVVKILDPHMDRAGEAEPDIRVCTFEEFYDAISHIKPGLEGIGCVFRGQSNAEWALVPKVGRGDFQKSNFPLYFSEWKDMATQYLTHRPENDLEWLAIAQHHGLATNLLDWTYNPLAAAFFAASEESENDAAVFAYSPVSVLLPGFNPFGTEGTYLYKPSHIASRISRQHGVFTLHNPSALDLRFHRHNGSILRKIIIDNSYRKILLSELAKFGISRATLFPDLDGLAQYLNWRMRNETFSTFL